MTMCLLKLGYLRISLYITLWLQLLTEEELEKVHNRGLALAEGQSKSFHCKTADCKGWCVYEDDVSQSLLVTMLCHYIMFRSMILIVRCAIREIVYCVKPFTILR